MKKIEKSFKKETSGDDENVTVTTVISLPNDGDSVRVNFLVVSSSASDEAKRLVYEAVGLFTNDGGTVFTELEDRDLSVNLSVDPPFDFPLLVVDATDVIYRLHHAAGPQTVKHRISYTVEILE